MNIEQIQSYFKNEIVKGNYEVIDEIIPKRGNLFWLSILVENRPFSLQINKYKPEVIQEGSIEENYFQLDEFSNEQQIKIYEHEKRRLTD